ncbi:Putative uncharacterized protein [Moritella viscosa]|nr:Putative uncharacterized protein [Moritella viscosa]SGY85133.1 Putative uncharacterized protein [Moritella viscosa]SGY86189.1 Putative uncharacterized protein [Moritella viscosa]SHO24552.1 Putative uncharacterized protein [Moritella viscosa]
MVSIYETGKMRVEIGNDEVVKTFKVRPNYKKRYNREKFALLRLTGLSGFPEIIKYEDDDATLTMTRLFGENKEQLSDEALQHLRLLVERMLDAGVARHSLPERDLLIKGDKVSIVDFERVTLRGMSWSPMWFFSKKVTRYHLLRLISRHNPKLLSEEEKNKLAYFSNIREKLQVLKRLRSKGRKVWRSKSEPGEYTKKFESKKAKK